MIGTTVAQDQLVDALRASWSRETSNDPAGWSPRRPDYGQCAVTALVVQQVLGGRLLRTTVEGVSHYWNELDDGTELDLTRGQFRRFETGEILTRDRAYVLSYPDTEHRYRVLWALVNERLGSLDGGRG